MNSVFLVLGLPVRIARVALHRKLALGEPWKIGARLVNTLVPAFVLRTPTPDYETPEAPRTPEPPVVAEAARPSAGSTPMETPSA